MDTRNRATLSTNPPFYHLATPADLRGKTKIRVLNHPRPAVSADRPLFDRYHYIPNKGAEVGLPSPQW